MGNSSCTHDSNVIPTAKPMFSASSNPTVIPTILSDLTGSDTIQDGGRQSGSTHIHTCTHDSNAIPTAKPMFSGSSYPTVIGLPTILSDLTGSDKSKMAVANPKVLKSPLDGNAIQRRHWIARPRKRGIMILNRVASSSTSWNTSTSGFDDRHLEFRLPWWCGNVGSGATELSDPKTWYYDFKSRC